MAEQGDLVLKIRADASRARTTIENLKKSVAELNTVLIGTQTSMKGFSNTSDAMSQALATQLNTNLTAVNMKLDKMALKSKSASKAMKPLSFNMRQLGRDMTFLLSLPAGAFFGKVVKSVLTFDDAMTKATAKFPKVDASMRQLAEKRIKGLGEEFGISSAKIAEGLKFLGQAGLEFKSAVSALPSVVAFFKATGASDFAATTDKLTDAVEALGKSSDDPIKMGKAMERMGDLIIRASNEATVSATQLLDTISNKAAGMAKAMKLGDDELVAFAATLAATGIKGKKGGDAISQILTNITKKAIENREVFEEKLPIFNQLTGEIKPLAQILATLDQRLDGLSAKEVQEFFGELGLQVRSTKVLQQLIGLSGKYADQLKNLAGAHGEARKQAEKLGESMQERMNRAFVKMENAFISFTGAIAPVLETIASLISGIADGLAGLGDTSKKWLMMIAGAVAVAGPLTMMLNIFNAWGKQVKSLIKNIPKLKNKLEAVGRVSKGVGAAFVAAFTVENLTSAYDEMAKARRARLAVLKQEKELSKDVNMQFNALLSMIKKYKATGTISEKESFKFGQLSDSFKKLTGHTVTLLSSRRKLKEVNEALKTSEKKLKEEFDDTNEKILASIEAFKKRKLAAQIPLLINELLRLGAAFDDVAKAASSEEPLKALTNLKSAINDINRAGGLFRAFGVDSNSSEELTADLAAIFAEHGIVGKKFKEMMKNATEKGWKPALIGALGEASTEVFKALENDVKKNLANIDKEIKKLEKRRQQIQKRPEGTSVTPINSFQAVKSGTVEAYRLLFGVETEDDQKKIKELSEAQLEEQKMINKNLVDLQKRRQKVDKLNVVHF